MEKYLRYKGEFRGKDGSLYRVELHQDSDGPFAVGELRFEADSPLVIEWPRADKLEPIVSSSATLAIESPGDRTFADLYTERVGAIRMDVYRDDALYWSGTLDPEFYEEPYERGALYPVSLTFSDFGLLDRLEYDLDRVQTLEAIVTSALAKSGVNYTRLEQSYISSMLGGQKCSLSSIKVRSDNFIDEEGERSTYKDVLTGILRPLALRMEQRCGLINIYDLNGLHAGDDRCEIYWTGSSSTMSTDKVYSKTTITFSPYYSTDVVAGTPVKYTAAYDVTMFNPNGYYYRADLNSDEFSYYDYFSYYDSFQWNLSHRLAQTIEDGSFTVFISKTGQGFKSIGDYARYAHIEFLEGGKDACDCVASRLVAFDHRTDCNYSANALQIVTCPRQDRYKNDVATPVFIYDAGRIEVTNSSWGESRWRKEFNLRVSLEVLFDSRYNPFGQVEDGWTKYNNNPANMDNITAQTSYLFVPVSIVLYADSGNVYHYENKGRGHSKRTVLDALSKPYACRWVSGKGDNKVCWLEYYDPENVQTGTGIYGWKKNRQNIGRPELEGKGDYVSDAFKRLPEGEYIDFPPEPGRLEISVYPGYIKKQYGDKSAMIYDVTLYEADALWWQLYKAPEVKIVSINKLNAPEELEEGSDIEYKGLLNNNAREDLSIDTVCGTATGYATPTARGLYYNASTGEPLGELTRGGHTDIPERLLLNTVYSQHAERHTVLSGECEMCSDLRIYTEANQGERVFALVGDRQNLLEGTSEAVFCELSPDEYLPI